MAEKLMIINGGTTLPEGAAAKLQVNEDVEIPSLPEGFEREYAPTPKAGDTEIVIPNFERPVNPKPELTTEPAKTTKEDLA